jgi:hypothetical protein
MATVSGVNTIRYSMLSVFLQKIKLFFRKKDSVSLTVI